MCVTRMPLKRCCARVETPGMRFTWSRPVLGALSAGLVLVTACQSGNTLEARAAQATAPTTRREPTTTAAPASSVTTIPGTAPSTTERTSASDPSTTRASTASSTTAPVATTAPNPRPSTTRATTTTTVAPGDRDDLIAWIDDQTDEVFTSRELECLADALIREAGEGAAFGLIDDVYDLTPAQVRRVVDAWFNCADIVSALHRSIDEDESLTLDQRRCLKGVFTEEMVRAFLAETFFSEEEVSEVLDAILACLTPEDE